MALSEEDKIFIQTEDNQLKLSLENKVVKIVMGQIITALPIIFFLGGIFFQFKDGVEKLDYIQTELEVRQTWIAERERSEAALTDWAETQGYKPSKYTPRKYYEIKTNQK